MNDINVEQFIRQQNTILDSAQTNIWHILLCFDDNYALAAGINILSIINNNLNQSIYFHLFMQNVSDKNRYKFNQIKASNISITEYIINDKFVIASDNTTKFSISACFRLIASPLLKDITNKLLYVDSDTLCLGELSALFELELGDHIVAAVRDASRMQKSQCEKMNITYGSYFNSGVVLFNTVAWNQQSITEKTLSLLNSNKIYQYPDQNVMNIVVKEKRILLDKIYNFFIALSPSSNEDSKVRSDIKIIHYVTKNKPWHEPYRTTLFDSYLMASPWCDEILPLYESRSISSSRKFARLMFKQHKYFIAIKHYLIYLQRKLIYKK